jgi:hypothetical protein
LSERLADGSEFTAAIVARHFTEAHLFEAAARCWLQAAELSLSSSAHAEDVWPAPTRALLDVALLPSRRHGVVLAGAEATALKAPRKGTPLKDKDKDWDHWSQVAAEWIEPERHSMLFSPSV